MPKPKNIAVVQSLKEKLSRARSVVLTDYRGLSHKQLEDLHKALKKVEAEYVVAKNSLLRIAGGPESTGPTGTLFAYQDEIAPIKELYKTIKAFSLPKVKFGLINGIVYNELEIERIAKLPTKEILQGQLVNRLSSPLYAFAYALNYNLQKLVYVLSEVEGLKAVSDK